MAEYGYFAHYSPRGVSPWYWFEQVSYSFIHAGENLAVHFTDSGEVVQAWMRSPTHRANIMNAQFTEIGIGTATGTYQGHPTVFVVQLFGAPNPAGAVTALPAPRAQVVATAPPSTASTENLPDPQQAVAGEETGALPSPAEEFMPPLPAQTEIIPDDPVSAASPVAAAAALSPTESPSAPVLVTTPAPAETAGWARFLTQPGAWLQLLYALIAVFVITALTLSVVVEWRRQQPLQIAYALMLLCVMGALLHIHVMLSSGVTVT
jgi:hypothetical protein